ncbi:MAG: ABC transporter permease [Ilumatobacteraceae bacterium]
MKFRHDPTALADPDPSSRRDGPAVDNGVEGHLEEPQAPEIDRAAEPVGPAPVEPAHPAANRVASTKLHHPHGPWRWTIRSLTFVRKELAEILRQPRLLVLLVVGPFVLLLLFGTGYSQNTIRLHTLFVGEQGSIYEETLSTSSDQLNEFVENEGFVSDKDAALRSLEDGDVDLVVVFPDDPLAQVTAGEQATIEVFDREMDPIQRTAIAIAARLAVQEVNATVLSTFASAAQEGLAPAASIAGSVLAIAEDVNARDPADPEVASLLAEAEGQLDDLSAAINGSADLLNRLAPDTADTAALSEASAVVDSLQQQAASADGFDSETFVADARSMAETTEQLTTIDPAVLVRPFTVENSSVIATDIDPTDYFTPAALALLLQHLALTFAALSLVRDRSTGLFELLRIGPLSSMQILFGKCAAYLIVGSAVAAALTASATFWLGVPFSGEVAWFAAMVVGVLLASLALGMVLSSVSSTESQAVQFAMLTLLAGMFFSGFILGLDNLAYPVKYISWTLPVTYGIRSFQTVMLLGEPPAIEDVLGLTALVVVYGSIAVFALRRSLRSK